MGRECVVCQGPAKTGRTVFPFPRSHEQRKAWLAALPVLPITSVEGWSPGRKHGVCDRHFLSQDVTPGYPPSLASRAVPVTELCLQTPHTEMPQSRLRALLTELDQSRLQTPPPRPGLRLSYSTSSHTGIRRNQTTAILSRGGNSTGRSIVIGDVKDAEKLGSERGTVRKEERGKIGTGTWQVYLKDIASELAAGKIGSCSIRVEKTHLVEGKETESEKNAVGKAEGKSLASKYPGEEEDVGNKVEEREKGHLEQKVGRGKRKARGIAGRRPVKKARKFDANKGMGLSPCVLLDKSCEASSASEFLLPKNEVHDDESNLCENNNSNNTCLVCGKESGALGLVCVLRACKVSNIATSLGALVARIVGRTKREVTSVSAKMCSRCLSLIQEVVKIEQHLKTKKHIIKDMFETTFQNQCEKTEGDTQGSQNENLTLSAKLPEADSTSPSLTMSITSVADSKVEDVSDNYVPVKIDSDDTRKSTRRKASVKTYHCPHCKEKFTGLALWVQHLSKHSDEEDEESRVETKTVTQKFKKKTKPGNNPCEECGKLFSSKRSLLAHASEHPKGSDCLVCGRFLTTRARLKAHLFKFHGIGEEQAKRVKCYSCGKLFGTVAGLRYHVNVVHQIGRKYVCEHCKKVFHYHVPYKSHMLYNHGEKKVVCQTCGEKFFTISKLNNHINAVHRGAQSWTCNKCDAKFTTHTSYRHHMNAKHLGVQHTCSYCKSQFHKRSSLLAHLTKHSIHVCRECQETFFCSDALRTHMLVAHGKELVARGKRKQQNIQQPDHQHVQQQSQHVQQQNQEQRVTSFVINDLLVTAVEMKSDVEMETGDIEIPTDHIKIPPEHVLDIPTEHIDIPQEQTEMPPEGLALRAKDIDLPTRHLEMTTVHRELQPHEHVESQSEHMEVGSEVTKVSSDNVEMKSKSVEMETDRIGMPQGVSLINVQILKQMESGEEVPLGSEQVMLTPAAHQLAIPTPLNTSLTEDDLASPDPHHSHALEESSPALVVPDHHLEAQGHSHALDVSSPALISSPVHEAPNNISGCSGHALATATVSTLGVSDNGHSPETHAPLESSKHTPLDTPEQHTLENADDHHHPHPLPSSSTQQHPSRPVQPLTVTRVEGKGGAEGGGTVAGMMDRALGGKLELRPVSVIMDSKGEVKYQYGYVMYIAAPTEDANQQ